MTESRGELDMYSDWFGQADLDKDGVLSGPEAVQFFLRSGLPQHPTLFKIWQYVAGDRSALNRQEFYTAMKLVSLAQMNNGVLDETQAMRLVNGLAGPIPPPRMQGLAIPKGIEMAGPGAAPPSAAPGRPPVYAAGAPPPGSMPGMQMPQAPGSYPGGGYPGAGMPPQAAMGGFPPLTPEQANAFQAAFTQLDLDRDGYVQGVHCFGVFMQSGLPKEVLKAVWDLVAGDEGQLSRHQFAQALYLIDCVKRGIPLPAQLPPGQFPPVAGTVNLGQMMGTPQDIYQASLQVPPLMPRAAYQPAGAPAPVAFQSQVPAFDAGRVGALEGAERMRLEAEREAALKQEAERKKAEEERAAAQAKRDFFTGTLAELRLAQSKVTRAVVEAQQRCEMERAEAERMEADYNRAYAEFSVKHAQNAPLVEALRKIQEEKAALAQKLESLRVVVEQLESVDPEWELREKGECQELNQEIAALSVRKEELQRTADAVEAQRGVLAAHVAALKKAAEGVDSELAPLKEQVDKLAAEAGKEGDAVVALLKQLAPLYNKLYDTAKQALVPLPAEALATMKREAVPFKYDDLAVAGAESWGDFNDEGFKVVSALPLDTRLTTFTSPSLTAAAAAAEDVDPPAAATGSEEGAAAAPAAAGEEGAAADTAADPAEPAVAAVAGEAVVPGVGSPEDNDRPPVPPPEEENGGEGVAGDPSGGSEAALAAVAAEGEGEGSLAGAAAGAAEDTQPPSRKASDAAAQNAVLSKHASTAAAEEEAVQAAAEAGVLASAIAEALAGSRPGSKAGSAAPSKQTSNAAEGFAVTFDEAVGDAGAAAVPPPASIDAFGSDAFTAGFSTLSLDQKPSENGAVAAAPVEAVPAAVAAEEPAAADASAAAAKPAEAAPADSWTAF